MRTTIGALAAATLLISACAGHHRSSQSDPDAVRSPLPVVVQFKTTGCTSPLDPSSARPSNPSTLVTVGPKPTSGTLRWYAGMNAKDCSPTSTTLDQATARKLAAAIRSAPKSPDGVVNCPFEDGHTVDIYLDYTGQSEPEVVHFEIDGCATLTAPGRGARTSTATLREIVRPFAPSYARSRLG